MPLADIITQARKQQTLGQALSLNSGTKLQRRASISLSNPVTSPEPLAMSRMPLSSILAECGDTLTLGEQMGGGSVLVDFLDFLDPYVVAQPTKRFALKLIRAAATLSTAFRSFPQLTRTVVLYQLTLRVLDPYRINQARTGLCGPVSLAVELVRSRPDAYVQFALELAESGAGRIADYEVKPDPSIRNYRVKVNSIPQADFLVLASLRNSARALEATTNLAQYEGTRESDLFEWCKRCGYPQVMMYITPPQLPFWPPGQAPLALLLKVAYAVMVVAPKLGISGDKGVAMVYPPGSASGVYPFRTRLEAAERIAHLLACGYKVFLKCNIQLAEAAETYSRLLKNGRTMLEGQPEARHAEILKGFQAVAQKDATSKLGNLAMQPHWVLLNQFLISGDRVSIEVVHHGGVHSFLGLPLDGVLAQLLGFVAAKPAWDSSMPTPSLSAEAPA
ncbi:MULTISPECIES: hypothetical protein [unclassified Burkholderia]|uniref:hypothetical protein n=1 Tax=unclassified Burkholderia TaxID=2613784 RepID=UPI0014221FFF|nr:MULTISPECIES: hypothetical protein [unclassified Burkholderia]NIE83306.1 hypothetical protein [Burkholderia sp. Tr-860]NIF62074.1 hypothetical protein [Burkholderia sp. Cy-647]NIF96653.1 hypothetical protein [Burkholderia sp. Ax-1720]